jgi:hypothetical protein
MTAISALATCARLGEMFGKNHEAASYRKRGAAIWYSINLGLAPEIHLVWDKVLGLNLFPKDVVRTRIAFYQVKQNAYDLPLDFSSAMREIRLASLGGHTV